MLINVHKGEEEVDQPSPVKDDLIKKPIVPRAAGTRKSPRFQDKSTPTPEPLESRPNETAVIAGLLNVKKEPNGKNTLK
jgi:hypothetical protein